MATPLILARLLRWLGCGVLFPVSLLLVPSLALSQQPLTRVADLRYGVALYHYYQQDYLPALAELMVADSRDGIQGHGDNPELIAGGISLAFGMHQHAEQVFSRILQDERRPQSVRDAAWFYLGKIHYLHGEWAQAQESFARVGPDFDPALRHQLQALQINLRVHLQDLDGLEPGRLKLGSWTPYALYNLGAAQARAGNFEQAQAWLRQLSRLDIPSDRRQQQERWALEDKAYTALGYSFLAQKDYTAAEREFKRVRLAGPYANQALLGYGWAAVARGDYRQALQPWQQLRQRSLIHPPVQESLLALPYAYEKLGGEAAAMESYSDAQGLLERELALVRSLRASLGSQELIALVAGQALDGEALRDWAAQPLDESGAVAAAITDEGSNWLRLDQTSIIRTRANYLAELFAQNQFQTAVLQMRDLMRLQQLLRDWQPKLDIYQSLLQQRFAARRQSEQQLGARQLPQRNRELQQQRQQLGEQIARIERDDDYLALADGDTRANAKMLARAEAALQRLQAAGRSQPEAEERLRMLRGLLLWSAAQDYPGHLANLKASLTQADTALAQLEGSRARLDQLLASDLDIAPLQQRLRALGLEIDSALNRSQRLLNAQAELLGDQVDIALALHEQRLNYYLAQAHLSLARLQDAQLRRQE